MKTLFDGYSRKARLYPTLLVIAPVLIYLGFLFSDNLKRVTQNFLLHETKAPIAIMMGVALIFVVFVHMASFFIRNRGKIWEEKIFRDGYGFPTTRLLLWKDHSFSEIMKQRLHDAIKTDFQISLPNRNEEEKDIEKAEQTIRDAVDLIRPTVSNGRIVIQYNTQYGFVRNTLASVDLLVVECAVCSVFSYLTNQNKTECILFAFFVVLFGLIWSVRQKLLMPHANRYAKTLLQEYYEQSRRTTLPPNNPKEQTK